MVNTFTEMEPVIGRTYLIRFEGIEVPCRVKDLERSYGKLRMEVEPVNGTGRQWIDSSRIKGQIQKRFEERAERRVH